MGIPDAPGTDPLAGNPAIVLIHGLWMTPRSWEHWVERYQRRGYEVLTPAYPGLEGDVEALREDSSPIEALTHPRHARAARRRAAGCGAACWRTSRPVTTTRG